MKCPDCKDEVLAEVAYCFSCLRHLPADIVQSTVEESAIVESISAPETKPSKPSRSWEPGILGTVQAFGRAAANSSWRRSKAEQPG